ncbi:DUF4189 domain-containing protein [Nocardia yamanashiensis]|uniref:DUF4189 domain-containing protein n=1 Tax=Nocardia yamanashiensis TaxID=209247 RepID=UPI00082D080D|nr:DUF4189 domain-containing protein [Nocardia yamanashiensis]
MNLSLNRSRALGVIAATATALVLGATGTSQAADADGNEWGSLAYEYVGNQLHTIVAVNYDSQESAEAAALSGCETGDCIVHTTWANGCVAVASRTTGGRNAGFWAQSGPTRAEASRKTLAATGTDPNPLMVSLGSSQASSARVVSSECTRNAG